MGKDPNLRQVARRDVGSPVDGGFAVLLDIYLNMDESDLDRPYGAEINYELPLTAEAGVVFGVGMEFWQYDDGVQDDSIDMIPLSFGVYRLLAGGEGVGLVGKIGVRYFLGESDLDLDDDDALALKAGLDLRLAFNESISLGLGASYQGTIDDFSVAGEELSVGGAYLNVGLFGVF